MKRYKGLFKLPKIPGKSFEGVKTLTQQNFKASCDVNNIIDKFTKNGIIDSNSLNKKEPRYGDFSDVSYIESLEKVAAVRSSFELLPADIRARFDNDPAKVIDFVSDSKNHDECVEMGFLDEQDLADVREIKNNSDIKREKFDKSNSSSNVEPPEGGSAST